MPHYFQKRASCGSFVIHETLPDASQTTSKLCACSLCLWRTRRRSCSTAKVLPLFPGVLCILSPVVHGMTPGCLKPKRTPAALPGHCHFHVFRARLRRWPQLFSTWSEAAKKRRLLSQAALSHLSIYLSLSVCIHVYPVNATELNIGGAFTKTRKKRTFASSLPRFSSSISFLFPLLGLSKLRAMASQNDKSWTVFWRSAVLCWAKSYRATWPPSWGHSELHTLRCFASSEESTEIAWHSQKKKNNPSN